MQARNDEQAKLLFSLINNYQSIQSEERHAAEYERYTQRNHIKGILKKFKPDELKVLSQLKNVQGETLLDAACLTNDFRLINAFAVCFDADALFAWIFDAINRYSQANRYSQKFSIRKQIVYVLKPCNQEQLETLSDLQDSIGCTLLQYACEMGDMELISVIIEALWYDEDDLCYCNDGGENLLHSVILNENNSPEDTAVIFTNVLTLLQKHGKDQVLLQQKNDCQQTPAELAWRLNKTHLVALMDPPIREEKVADLAPEKFRALHEFFTAETKPTFFLKKIHIFIQLMQNIKEGAALEKITTPSNNIWAASTTVFNQLINNWIDAKPSIAELNQYLDFLQSVKTTEPLLYSMQAILDGLRPAAVHILKLGR